jgi:hypothetical protein
MKNYTKDDLFNFAAYRAKFSNPRLVSYKTMSDCFFEWKIKRAKKLSKESHPVQQEQQEKISESGEGVS